MLELKPSSSVAKDLPFSFFSFEFLLAAHLFEAVPKGILENIGRYANGQ